MPKVMANGLAAHYELDDFTDPWRTDFETIFIQHGTGRSAQFWRHWVPPLANRYRVIRRDFRGFGQSQDPGPDYQWSIDDLLDDLEAFLDALELPQVHYVGESVGGVLGIAFAARSPERFKSLTLCSTPTTLGPREELLRLGHATRADAVRDLGPAGMARALIERGILAGGTPERTEWVVREWAKTPEHVLQGIGKLNLSFNVAALLPQIRIPTLILAPARSPITRLSEQVTMRDAIPDARICVIDTFGHEIYVDDADGCIRALVRFLDELNSRDSNAAPVYKS